jgi:hypothetical protein
MVINPDHVALGSFAGEAPASRGVGPRDYEYVIVTQSAWVNDFQLLADWRTKQGLPAVIVTTDWIFNEGGYAGSNLEKVRAFVEDAHDTWGAMYFLLGADTDVIPYHVRTITIPEYWTDDIDNDTYYADYDEDWICEVNVGRVSMPTPTAISTFIDKVFTYEKNPPLSDYITKAVFLGFDITDPGDADGELAKENIRALHLPLSWTLNTEYDAEDANPHFADVLGYLNEGHHLVNHHDHCNWNCMGTGWISHGDLMFNSHVQGLSNGQRQSILFAVGCYPAHFPSEPCIGEAFLRNANGGGIAFMGNTCTGWGGPPEDQDWYSVRQDRFFYRNLFDDGIVRLGDNFTDLKNDEYDSNDPYNLHQYCFTQMHLLGDPGMPVWSDEPQGLTVVHDGTVLVGEYTDFSVQVDDAGGPVDGATVCLWKPGDVYEVATTVAGAASFGITPSTGGTMHVTVTGRNCLPYEGQVIIYAEPIPAVSQWGMSVMLLLMLAAGTIVLRRAPG